MGVRFDRLTGLENTKCEVQTLTLDYFMHCLFHAAWFTSVPTLLFVSTHGQEKTTRDSTDAVVLFVQFGLRFREKGIPFRQICRLGG